MRPFAYLLALVAVSISTPVSAANLLVNPTFDENLAGWGLEPAASPAWDPMDVDNSQSSGSARLTMVGEVHGTQGILQYVAVVPGAQYDFSAWIQVGGDAGTGGQARIFGWWMREHGTPRCNEVISSLGTTPAVEEGESGQWVLREETVSAPADAHCALVKAALYKTEPTGEFIAYIDDFIFAPEPSSTLLHMVALATLALLAMLGVKGGRREEGNSLSTRLELISSSLPSLGQGAD